MSNQRLTSLQAGISVQRIAYGGSSCPCMTITNTQYTNQDLSYRALVNMTLINDVFTGCKLDSTNFTKSTLASCQFKQSTGDATVFFQVSMSDVSFNNCALGRAQLNGSWLQNVFFFGTDVSNSSFFDSNLTNVRFDPLTNLAGCVFTDAKFRSCFLKEIKANKLNCRNATMSDCNLYGGTFPRIQLTQASLLGCVAVSTIMPRANFENANLLNCDFTDSTLTGASFYNATLAYCLFLSANLDSVNFSAANLESISTSEDTVMTSVVLDGATLSECNFAGIVFGSSTSLNAAEMANCNFDAANLSGIDLGGSTLSTVSLLGTNLFGADFSKATLTELATDADSTFKKSRFINANLSNIVWNNCNLKSSDFGHATLSQVIFKPYTKLAGGVSFTDCEMNGVSFVEVALDGVVFDQARLANVDMTHTSLVAASFVSATLADVLLTGAVLSVDESPMNSEANLVAKFENAKLTRVLFDRGAFLRFTIFTESTLMQCVFLGTSDDYLNVAEASFDNAIVSDTTFQWCNLTYASFNNGKLTRVNFVGCAMDFLEVNNVEPEYCSADETTILPRTWKRDSNGWIYIDDPGPVPKEEARNEIVSVAITNGGGEYRAYRSVKKNLGNGAYEVEWLDGNPSRGSNLLKLNTVTPFIEGDPVFLKVNQGTTPGDDYYVHGAVESLDRVSGTCTLLYYTDVDATSYASTQLLMNVFSEYFENDKKTVTVGLFEDKVYRWVQSIQDGYITWWDNSQTLASLTTTLSLVRPILINLSQLVFVIINKDAHSYMNNNYYLWGQVTKNWGDGTYDVNYAMMPPGSQTAPTRQNINSLYVIPN